MVTARPIRAAQDGYTRPERSTVDPLLSCGLAVNLAVSRVDAGLATFAGGVALGQDARIGSAAVPVAPRRARVLGGCAPTPRHADPGRGKACLQSKKTSICLQSKNTSTTSSRLLGVTSPTSSSSANAPRPRRPSHRRRRGRDGPPDGGCCSPACWSSWRWSAGSSSAPAAGCSDA